MMTLYYTLTMYFSRRLPNQGMQRGDHVSFRKLFLRDYFA